MAEAPPDPRSDRELIVAIQGGEQGAFAALYWRHREFAMKVAWRFSSCDADALDAVQNAFVYLAGKLRATGPGAAGAPAAGGTEETSAGENAPPVKFELTAKLTTFLYPVVKHEAMALRRKAQRMKLGADLTGAAGRDGERGGGGVFEELPARDAPADAGLSARRVAKAVAGLSSGQREVVLLRFIDGLSMEEISQVLGVPVGTVKSRLHLALKSLADDKEAVRMLTEGK
jgi:RNA polymerase sigma-70 factor (ECF subfamily)